MKLNRKIPLLGLIFLFGLLFSSIQAMAADTLEYNLKKGDYQYYECTYAYNSVGQIKVKEEDPLNTTLIRIDVVEASIGSDQDVPEAWGSYYADLWYLNKGDNWEQVEDDLLYVLDSNAIETFGLVGFTDADVSKEQIISFFTDSPYLIPNPAALTEAKWTEIRQVLEGNILLSYGQSMVASFSSSERKFVIENLGPDVYKYTLEVVYNDMGYLALYNLYNVVDIDGEDHTHIIFRAELLGDSVNFPPDTDAFPWEAYLIAGGVIAAVIIAVIIWRKKR